MADWEKLIVSCTANCDFYELDRQLLALNLGTSCYHSGEVVQVIERCHYPESDRDLYITLVGQTRYGRGQDSFLRWLKPFVKQGSGAHQWFAIQMDEHTLPTLWYLDTETMPYY